MAEKEKQTITTADVATVSAAGLLSGLVKPKIDGKGTVKAPTPARAAAYAKLKKAREERDLAVLALQEAEKELAQIDAAERADKIVAEMSPELLEAVKRKIV